QDTPQETLVDVNVGVTPGLQYKMSELQLSGYKAFEAEKLRALIHLQLWRPANTIQLGRDLDEIKKLYGTRGYMAATIKPTLNSMMRIRLSATCWSSMKVTCTKWETWKSRGLTPA